jgi:hypothetical protein
MGFVDDAIPADAGTSSGPVIIGDIVEGGVVKQLEDGVLVEKPAE